MDAGRHVIMSDRYTLRARYLFPVDGPPVADAALTVASGRIDKTTSSDVASAVDLGNAAIIPGFVNAHTHLEFSDLETPLGHPGQPFPDWIRQVVRWRASSDPDGNAVASGLRESLRCGVTTIGEIATGEGTERPRGSGVAFRELLGLSTDRIDPLMQTAKDYLDRASVGGDGLLRAGLSPHAPYTVGLELLERIVQLSADRRVPVAMHLAETVDELELLQSHSGPFLSLLMDLDAWDAAAFPRGVRILDYLQLLSQSHRALVIHGNYLADDEIDFLATHADRMSAVYCPRTHAYFGHGRYPLAEMLEQGVHVAVGTDSRASNPDLSILNELRFIADHHTLPLSDILRMGTLSGAEALGVADEVGSLVPGKRANFAVVRLPNRAADDPHELILDADSEVDATYVGGTRTES